MNRSSLRCLLATLGVILAVPALAVNVTISGQFRPDTPTTAIFDQDCEIPELPYQIVGPLSTDVSGPYETRDSGNTGPAGSGFSQDTVLAWYTAMPDLTNPQANLLQVVDDVDTLNLVAGTEYYVLAQPYCLPVWRGVWGQLILGPGTVQGPQTAATPAHWQGTWTNQDDVGNAIPPEIGCPDTWLDVNGPITLDTSGTWFVSDSSGFDGRGIWISFYDGPFDPDNPQQNYVGGGPGGGFELEAGDYTIVTQAQCDVIDGDWYYVMWPPHPFELTAGSSATYYDQQTSGQGQLVHINPDNFVFLAWFTYDSEPPAGVTRPQAVGNSSQRWLTMAGTFGYGDNSVELTVYSPEANGVFNQPPVVGVEPVGTATMDMDSCTHGELRFNLDSGESGTAIMNLLVGDVRHCEDSFRGPGVLYE